MALFRVYRDDPLKRQPLLIFNVVKHICLQFHKLKIFGGKNVNLPLKASILYLEYLSNLEDI